MGACARGHLGVTSMARFGKDRERIDRPRGLSSEPGVPASGPASGEPEMLARERLEIRAPGKLFGNIATPSLVIHEGVVFEGQCAMGGPDALRTEKDRKIALFPKDDRPGDGAQQHKVISEVAK